MRKLTFILLLIFSPSSILHANVINDGTFTFIMSFSEFASRDLDTTCTVKINGENISILHDGSTNIKGKKGDIIDKGILIRHKATSKWIIGNSKEDQFAEEIGGCTGGPNIVDLKNKVFWTC